MATDQQHKDEKVLPSLQAAIERLGQENQREALKKIAELLLLDVEFKQSNATEVAHAMNDQLENKFQRVISWLRRRYPSLGELTLSILLVLILGVMAEVHLYKTRRLTLWSGVSAWYAFLTLLLAIASMDVVVTVLRDYFLFSSKRNVLRIIQLVDNAGMSKDPEQALGTLNPCIYASWSSLLRTDNPCKFDVKKWVTSLFRKGWYLDEENHEQQLNQLAQLPYEDGLAAILIKERRHKAIKQKRD